VDIRRERVLEGRLRNCTQVDRETRLVRLMYPLEPRDSVPVNWHDLTCVTFLSVVVQGLVLFKVRETRSKIVQQDHL
jgi:hypothetical protein